jgi:predicted membrane protein
MTELTVPFLGILIVIYLVLSFRKGGKGFLSMGGEGPWGIFILNTIILILIFSTGALNSPVFFLLYFLGFGIAFVFEPSVTFIFVLGAILIFIPEVLRADLLIGLLKVGSLLLISPLAYFFGREYRKTDKQETQIEALEERTEDAADTISQDIAEVVKNEKANLKEEDIDKLNEVLEETEDLREESKQQS